MNEDKKFVIVFYGIISVLVIILSVFLFISIRSSKDKHAMKFSDIKIFNPDNEIISSKTEAYNEADKEHIFDIQEQNVNIDFKKLFNKDSIQVNENPVQDQKVSENHFKRDKISINNPTAINKKSFQNQNQTKNSANSEPYISNNIDNNHVVFQRREGFYTSSEDQTRLSSDKGNLKAFRAAVHFQQTVKNSSVVKFRTLDNIVIDGVTIPANTFFYGEALLCKERVKIKLSRIFYNSKLYPFNYTLYDADGIEGIYVPGLMIHDAIKESKESAISDMNVNIPYIGRGSVNFARKNINDNSCILTQDYVVYLK